MSKEQSETPLMKQFNAIKAKYEGALLLFRVGDFYETFGDDAVKASKVLGIVLTKRNNGGSEMPLAGFPHHSLDTYLPKLVRAGYRVAVCDQLEDPKSVKGIVKRGVTELVTPGVSFNDNVLQGNKNNFLAAIHIESKNEIGIAFLDISTGDFFLSQGDEKYIDKTIQSFLPSEILASKSNKQQIISILSDSFNTFFVDDWVFQFDFCNEKLTNHFQTKSLKGFGVDNYKSGIIAAGVILHYLSETEHHEVKHISSLSRLEDEKYVWLDRFTIRNLELVHTPYDNGVPLIDIVDKTATPMGARLLRNWMLFPLKEENVINERLATVEQFVNNESLSTNIYQHLKQIGDLERLISKVAVKRINPRELQQLKRALSQIKPIIDLLKPITHFQKLCDQLNPCEYLLTQLNEILKTDPPLLTNQGGMINVGIHQELDELRTIAYKGKDFLAQVQQREIQETGISSLKISYNKVFGYYIEVTNVHKDKVPASWIRKQTLVNAERYITEELKIYEEKILTAEDKIFVIEQQLFNELVNVANDYIANIQQNARLLSTIDVLLSFANCAITNNYCKPTVDNSSVLNIKNGRHPVIEKQLPQGEEYVPNDIYLDTESQQIIIITGPNMAGKSALLRQTALIVLLAQIGSYVPASQANIGIVDKVFTRVGASDNLSKGESTFMVEMIETASILNNLSDKSLILMDEIGRGTSTYDGISIAWSIVEYLHNHLKFKPKTLFATHYHELNQLAENNERVKNFNVSVKEHGNKVIFMRKLKEGGSEHSFGIHVAQIAGMPNQVLIRAGEIMHHLEKDKIRDNPGKKMKSIPQSFQMNIFEPNDPNYVKTKEILKNLDINTISPVEALLKLNEIKLLNN